MDDRTQSAPSSTTKPSQWAMVNAWRFLAQPNWPATLQATLADPLRSRLIYAYARQLDRRWSRTLTLHIDLKRAAAGDLAD
jgi:hypothetical protein